MATKSNFRLSDFKSALKTTGVLRNSRFELVVYPPLILQGSIDTKAISIRCHTGHLPAFNVTVVDYQVGQGQMRKMPKGYDQGHTLEFSFFNDIHSKVYDGLLRWSKMVIANNTENSYTINYFNNFVGSVIVKQLDDGDNVRYGYTLKDAYPIKIDTVNFDSSERDMAQVVKITFAFRYARTLDETKADDIANSPAKKITLETAVIDPTIKTRDRKYSTSNGKYKTRTTKERVIDIADNTMGRAAVRKKGAGLTYQQKYDSSSIRISASRIKGRGVNASQIDYIQTSNTQMQAALSSLDGDVINPTWLATQTQYQALTTDANIFYAESIDGIQQYEAIKAEIPVIDGLHSDVSDLKIIYANVTNSQAEMNIDYSEFEQAVNDFNNTTTISVG